MRFRIVASVLVALSLPSIGAAQQPEEQSAVSLDASDYGGFASMDMRFGDMADDFAVFMGGTLALLLKHRVYLGVRGAGLVTEETVHGSSEAVIDPTIQMGYGGVVVGYVIPTPSLVQFTAETLLAAGGVDLDEDADIDGDDEDWEAVFVFEPVLSAELKLARIVRLGFGVGYRFVGGVDTPGLEDRDLRGAVGTATLRVGWF